MSSEFEHELREARGTLPEPEADVTGDARSRALRAVRKRHPRARFTALAGTALALAVALGLGVGSFVVPSTTASQGPPGLGFLPEDDWYVLQAGSFAPTSSGSKSSVRKSASTPTTSTTPRSGWNTT